MKVYAPNKSYTGVSASVAFCNGIGETGNPRLLEWFKSHGYSVEEPELPREPEDIEGSEKSEKKDKAGTKKAGE